MKELSLHILDLVQNSIQANASEITISIEENSSSDTYVISIIDNGSGMNKITKEQILDPFFTTKNKKTGLGIPLLKQHTELSNGNVFIESEPEKGTKIIAEFGRSHFDRQPLGDITGTLSGLIRSYPKLDFEYKHRIDDKEFVFKTIEVKQELEGIPIESSEVIAFIREMINENLKDISQ